MAHIIDGKKLAQAVTDDVIRLTAAYSQTRRQPCLAILTAGEDPASKTYIAAKIKALEKAGMRYRIHRFPDSADTESVLSVIRSLNHDDAVHGILVQLPLPRSIDTAAALQALEPQKDVDGFTPVNLGRLISGLPCLTPCTPQGIMHAIRSTGAPVAGSRAVIVGRSVIVGKPLAALLTNADATVTLCHTKTKDLAGIAREADILIAAAGSPALITGEMVKPGAVVIDTGINRLPDNSRPSGYRLTGDVDFETASERAGWITPVPGGIGPLTVAMLLRNTLRAAQLQTGYPSESETAGC